MNDVTLLEERGVQESRNLNHVLLCLCDEEGRWIEKSLQNSLMPFMNGPYR